MTTNNQGVTPEHLRNLGNLPTPTNNQTTDPNYLSDCHNAAVYVVSADEGTNHYECLECKQACNFHPATPTNTIDNSLDEILHQLKVSISLSSKAPYPVFDDSIVGHAFDEAKDAINKTIMKARVNEVEKLLHKEVCEVMCGWSKQCDIKGHDCVPIRKHLAELRQQITKKYGRADK